VRGEERGMERKERGEERKETGVELANKASLGHADSLLFHGLMKRCTILLADRVKLIDAAHPAVREHQRAYVYI
jgi:hypothetical protein